jgi:hypothetical protein
MTLEQQFITIDDLLSEEAVDPFTNNATDPFDGSASSVSKEQLCIPLGACDRRNSMGIRESSHLRKTFCWFESFE